MHSLTTLNAGQLAAALQQANAYSHWLSPRRSAWLMPLLRLLTSTAAAIAGQIERDEMRG